jgi:hypothetical protein
MLSTVVGSACVGQISLPCQCRCGRSVIGNEHHLSLVEEQNDSVDVAETGITTICTLHTNTTEKLPSPSMVYAFPRSSTSMRSLPQHPRSENLPGSCVSAVSQPPTPPPTSRPFELPKHTPTSTHSALLRRRLTLHLLRHLHIHLKKLCNAAIQTHRLSFIEIRFPVLRRYAFACACVD